MKKQLIFLMALLAILPAKSDCYLTFGVNDTLIVAPSRDDSTQRVMVRAHFDGRLNSFQLTLGLPQGVHLVGYSRSDDMLSIPYTNVNGDSLYCSAPLWVNNEDSTVTLYSSISELGYAHLGFGDPDHLDCYGRVKWEAGDYEQMLELVFRFDRMPAEGASINITEYLSSDYDFRGYTVPTAYVQKEIHLFAPFWTGDVDGDGKLSIADVTDLIDLLLTLDAPNEDVAMQAADVDGDGRVTIADVTALIDLLLARG